jgi:hypothetical protein
MSFVVESSMLVLQVAEILTCWTADITEMNCIWIGCVQMLAIMVSLQKNY